MNLSFDMDIEDKEGQVPDRSISKLIRGIILHDLRLRPSCNFLPAHSHPCPYSGLEPLFRVYYPRLIMDGWIGITLVNLSHLSKDPCFCKTKFWKVIFQPKLG